MAKVQVVKIRSDENYGNHNTCKKFKLHAHTYSSHWGLVPGAMEYKVKQKY